MVVVRIVTSSETAAASKIYIPCVVHRNEIFEMDFVFKIHKLDLAFYLINHVINDLHAQH